MIDWQAETHKVMIPSYERLPLTVVRGQGCYIYDDRGEAYLDFYGGHAVAILGHSPPEVVRAITIQAQQLLFFSNVVYLEIQVRAAKALLQLCDRPSDRVFFCNSGAEANENALKLARKVTGRAEIVATRQSFHGRTAGALALTGITSYHGNGVGLPGDVYHMPFGDLEAASRLIGAKTAAVIVEPIQSMAGVICPPPGYLQSLAQLCQEAGALLIFDELQTGLGRIGAPSAAQAYGVRPAIQTFAKGLASGVPAGAVVAAAEVAAAIRPGDIGTTFGSGPLACAAILATVNGLLAGRWWEHAAELVAKIREIFCFRGCFCARSRRSRSVQEIPTARIPPMSISKSRSCCAALTFTSS
jgi:acetylornithine/succinyldiaminopimelate/putrescine aminotransferase